MNLRSEMIQKPLLEHIYELLETIDVPSRIGVVEPCSERKFQGAASSLLVNIWNHRLNYNA